jgi:hypothetical protein
MAWFPVDRSRQNAGSIAQHDQPAWILRNPTAVDRPSDRQVVMPVNDLFLAGVMRAFPEQFDGVFAFGFCHEPFLTQPRPGFAFLAKPGWMTASGVENANGLPTDPSSSVTWL